MWEGLGGKEGGLVGENGAGVRVEVLGVVKMGKGVCVARCKGERCRQGDNA